MKKHIFLLSILAMTSTFSFNAAVSMEHQTPIPLISFKNSIKQVNEDFYVGKIKNRNLWIVMERITDENINDWQRFAQIQNNSRVINIASRNLPHGVTTGDGTGHFESVLKEVSYKKNEVWIAYITNQSDPLPSTKPKFTSYDTNLIMDPTKSPAGNIKMFVTVTTSPEAKITSHMGVSITAESTFTNPEKSISIDLHSFAAKVMLMKNPERLYMVNAPTPLMEAIMAKAAPSNLFMGTKEMIKEIENRRFITFEDFNNILEEGNLENEKNELDMHCEIIDEIAKNALNKYKRIPNLREGDFRSKMIKEFEEEAELYLEKTDNGYLISSEKIEREKKKELDKIFSNYKNFNPFKEVMEILKIENVEELIKEYPPILSVDNIKHSTNYMHIYNSINSSHPWLTIKKGDSRYDWIFTSPFAPAGNTHLIAVNLQALANCRPLESSN